jgi:hypothetical protein
MEHVLLILSFLGFPFRRVGKGHALGIGANGLGFRRHEEGGRVDLLFGAD